MFAATWINLTQLSILGVEEHHIYIVVLLLLMGLLYFIVFPVMKWFMSFQSTRLLSYMMSSLLCLILLFILAMISEGLGNALEDVLKITLQCFSVFGGFLLILSFIGRFKKRL